MTPTAILAIVDGALTILEKVAPDFTKAFQSGQITVEQQQALLDRISKFRTGEAFSGPEWQPSTPVQPS